MRKASKLNRRKPLFILSKQLFFTSPLTDSNVVCIDSACQQGRNKNIDKITFFFFFGMEFLDLEALSEIHSFVSNSLRPHGLYSPWNSPGQNTVVLAIPFSRARSYRSIQIDRDA